MNKGNIKEFLESKEGQESLYFIEEYLYLNAELRRRRLGGLFINYENSVKHLNSGLEKGQRGMAAVAKRLFVIEMISQTLMSIEDLGAFCLAVENDWKNIPSKIIGYSTSEINEFYRREWKSEYLSELLLFPKAEDITSDDDLIKKIDIIQNQNVEGFKFVFNKIVEYRRFFSRLYSKSKHGNPLLLRFGGSLPRGIDPEDSEIVIVLDSKDKPFEDVGVCIIGKNTVEKSVIMMRAVSDTLVTLIHQYRDYLRFQGKYPPCFIFGENPLTKNEWISYKKQIEALSPKPLDITHQMPGMNTDVSELYGWLHSEDWKSKWFKQKEWEFQEGSKIYKDY